MEKRTVIAFVLSFLVLLIWSMLFTSKPDQAPKEATQPKEEIIGEKAPALKPAPKSATQAIKAEEPSAEIQKPAVDEKDVSVETPLFSAVFTSRGATIKSFKLKEYRQANDPESDYVELVDLEGIGSDFLEFEFARNSNQTRQELLFNVEEDSFTLGQQSMPRDLTFTALRPDGVQITQSYRIYPDRYPIDLTVKISNRTDGELEGVLKAHLRNIPPKDKASYYSFVGAAVLVNDELEELEPGDLEEAKNLSGSIDWMAYESDYFMSALVPEDPPKANFNGILLQSGILRASYIAPPFALSSLEQRTSRYTLYLGPRDLTYIKPMGKKLDRAINFGWTDIIAKPLLYTLRFFNQYVNNYGVAIILLTVLVKIIFWPLTHKSYKSMKEMQKLQPLMAKIREKHKNNREQMNKELMGLYKTYKVNPMGGCLPMVIQIPVFFALFRILGSSIELRHAPFFLWITDLSSPDRLFNFPFEIPFMSPPFGIPVLTLLMGASMFIQQKMTPTPGDPTQAKIMLFLPIIFTVMFINFPSGLVLYWLVNNVLSIGQQYRIKKSPA